MIGAELPPELRELGLGLGQAGHPGGLVAAEVVLEGGRELGGPLGAEGAGGADDLVGRLLGGSEVTATMSRAHAEIERLVAWLGRHLALAEESGLRPDQIDDLRACLYGLHAVLNLHFTQEEEAYFSLARNDRFVA